MKAWVLHDIGIENFTYDDVELPEINRDEVLVKVKAAGICGSDIPRAYETGAHVKPLIIGHEFAGEIAGVANPEDSELLGKRVGVFPLIPCGECAPCKNKQYEMCKNYNYLGSRCNGGFAEYVAVPKWNIMELSERVPYEAAAMLEPMAVAVHAIRRGFDLLGLKHGRPMVKVKGSSERGIENDECEDLMQDENFAAVRKLNVAVSGLGTIGLLVAMFLEETGVGNILVIGNKESQKSRLKSMDIPVENYCDAKSQDVNKFLQEKTNGTGVDLFFDCVGKNEILIQAIEAVKPAGAIVLVGNPYSDVELKKDVYWKILRKQIKLTGSWNSSFTGDENDDWHYAAKAVMKLTANPENLITHSFPMADLKKGFEIMHDKTEDYVKIMGVQG
jgi:L-iditol 2-dehydrogenase